MVIAPAASSKLWLRANEDNLARRSRRFGKLV
jgi:hypothetical protein